MNTSLDRCERCGVNSWDGNQENPKCPWCGKFKRRGSREELTQQIRQLREVALNALGFLAGMSIMGAEELKARLVTLVKETE
jgi:ribosomal protein L37E